MLITDEYRSQNTQLHAEKKHYGTSGGQYAGIVRELALELKTFDILDYGCGKGDFALNFPYFIKQYDPCVAMHSKVPEPADIVLCSDVLEHIEPDCLDDVLTDLQRVTKRYLVASIALVSAGKTLPDGRNAHLIVESVAWWKDKFLTRFDLDNEQLTNNGQRVILAYHVEGPYKYAE